MVSVVVSAMGLFNQIKVGGRALLLVRCDTPNQKVLDLCMLVGYSHLANLLTMAMHCTLSCPCCAEAATMYICRDPI